MNSRETPKLAMRPMLPTDVPFLAEIFRASIEDLTADDYSAGQQEAWASAADDEEAFSKSLEKGLTLVALTGGGPVGFISLQKGGLIDQLYVHPAVARTGVASALVEAIEKLAAARGVATLATDASDTAKPLFEKRGFVAERRNTIEIDGEYLGNTRMTKALAPKAAPDVRP